MNFGITSEATVPLRQARSERAALVNQALFGELYEVEEEDEHWVRVRLWHDGTTGWIERAAHHAVDESHARAYITGRHAVTRALFTPVTREGGWDRRLVPAGSVLPFFDASTRTFLLGEERHVTARDDSREEPGTAGERLARHALAYHNTPFVPGGRSPRGIDDTGLAQVAHRLAGISLPRDLDGQLHAGEPLSFLAESAPGDLLFFGDETRVSHVGIAWESGHVIHASGRTRVDKVDHHGIFNEETRRYTHLLKAIRRAVTGTPARPARH
jgi:cell wall-associated NlpC family hydrolase